jgi:Fe-S cluster assembly protein SufD
MTATAAAPAVRFDDDAFAAFLSGRSEPERVVAARRQAYAKFRELQAVPLDPEEWKRVDLRTFRPDRFALVADDRSAALPPTLLADRTQFAGHVAHVDGHCRAASLDDALRDRGVLFGSLEEFVRTHPERVLPWLGTKGVLPGTDRFSAWHAAFWTGGTVLVVPRGVRIEQPLHSLIALASDGAADFSHTLVVLEEGASATLLEETVSADPESSGLHVGAVELLVGPGANLRYVQLQNWNERTLHFAHQCGRVERDGFLQWTVGGLGAKLAHVHQDVLLDGPGAQAEVNGVAFAVDRQVLSYHTRQAHRAPDTRSDLLYKEVLRDRARIVWRGMIRVEPVAQRTDGYQKCDALMLSDDARADSIPGLEIEADYDRCTHGATCGRVDAEQLFYCMSRGLSGYEAMHMIVEGYFQEVFDRIPVEVVRETLGRTVERKLGLGD